MSEYTNFLSSSFHINFISYSIENNVEAFENNDMKYNNIIPTKILEPQKYVYK